MFKNLVKVFIVVLSFGVVCAFDIPNYEGYVTDKVGVFSENEKTDLMNKIEEIEKATSIEIAVLVVPTVDDDINLAAVDVGNARGVGKKGKDNGLMILIAVDDRKRSIQVGYGLEGTLPDLATKQMGDKHFPPNFKEGKYYQGIVGLLDDVLGYIKQDPVIMEEYSFANVRDNNFDGDAAGYVFFLFFILATFFGRWVTVPNLRGKGRKMRKYGRWMYVGGGLILSLVVTWVITSFVAALIISYLFLLFSILMAMNGRTVGGSRGVHFGGSGSSWGGGFGDFGGGSFGGGGSSGSR